MTSGSTSVRRKHVSGSISPDDVPDVCTTDRTLATTRSSPLLHRTLVTHAHVTAHVQDRIDRRLVADNALIARRRDGPGVPGLTGHSRRSSTQGRVTWTVMRRLSLCWDSVVRAAGRSRGSDRLVSCNAVQIDVHVQWCVYSGLRVQLVGGCSQIAGHADSRNRTAASHTGS